MQIQEFVINAISGDTGIITDKDAPAVQRWFRTRYAHRRKLQLSAGAERSLSGLPEVDLPKKAVGTAGSIVRGLAS